MLTRVILLGGIMMISAAYPQQPRPSSTFEVGGGATLLMPRQDYHNGWGIGLAGVWNFSPRYGINLSYSSAGVKDESSDKSRTVTSLVGSAEISFRRGEYAHGFTTIGLGTVSGEESTLFLFGIGVKIPVARHVMLRLELRDYFTEIGIPYFTFPSGHVALQGLGTDKYLELGLGVAYTFGEKEGARRKRQTGP